ncbi:PAS domain-containing protein [Methanobacterium spitsbergense]
MIYWNMDNKIVDANDKFLEIVGYTCSELENGKLDWFKMTLQSIDIQMKISLRSLKPMELIKILLKRYISIRTAHNYQIKACALLDEACFNGVVLILDITEREDMEKALKKSEEEHKHLVNYAHTAIYEIGFKDQTSKSVNEAFSKLLSYSKEELLAIIPFDILDDESRKNSKNGLKRINC